MGRKRAVFEYMYRDGGNWKTFGELLLDGMDSGAEAQFRATLEWGDQFVAEQVDVPPLQEMHFIDCQSGPSDLDHAFHEFVGIRDATMEDLERLEICGDVADLLARFKKASRHWDVQLSPHAA